MAAEGFPFSTGYRIDCREQPLFTEPEVDLVRVWPRGDGVVDVDYTMMRCPSSERLCREATLWLGGPVLLARRDEIGQIGAAIEKVRANVGELLAVQGRR